MSVIMGTASAVMCHHCLPQHINNIPAFDYLCPRVQLNVRYWSCNSFSTNLVKNWSLAYNCHLIVQKCDCEKLGLMFHLFHWWSHWMSSFLEWFWLETGVFSVMSHKPAVVLVRVITCWLTSPVSWRPIHRQLPVFTARPMQRQLAVSMVSLRHSWMAWILAVLRRLRREMLSAKHSLVYASYLFLV